MPSAAIRMQEFVTQQDSVVSIADAASVAISETGTSAVADGDYVLVTRKKLRDVGKETPPVNSKHSDKQRALTPTNNAKLAMSKKA